MTWSSWLENSWSPARLRTLLSSVSECWPTGSKLNLKIWRLQEREESNPHPFYLRPTKWRLRHALPLKRPNRTHICFASRKNVCTFICSNYKQRAGVSFFLAKVTPRPIQSSRLASYSWHKLYIWAKKSFII